MSDEKFAELVDLVGQVRSGRSETRNTSIRLPSKLHRAIQLAVDLGMDESMTSATTDALLRRVEEFVDREARIRDHEQHPEDTPTLAGVARMRARLTHDPSSEFPELINEVSAWWEGEYGPWALSRDEYDPPSQVLDAVMAVAAFRRRWQVADEAAS